MKTIFLTKGRVALVDDNDFEIVNNYKWCFDGVYAQRRDKGKAVRMHRFIFGNTDGKNIDHIDGNPLNNQRNNLRLCNQSQNAANKKKSKGTSIYKGVSWNKITGKWHAQIQNKYKVKNLGEYDSERQAAKVYDKVAKELFGNFAVINFN